MTEPVRGFAYSVPFERPARPASEPALYDVAHARLIWKTIFDNFIETTDQGAIKQFRMIGRRDDDAVRRIRLFKQLQEGIERFARAIKQ